MRPVTKRQFLGLPAPAIRATFILFNFHAHRPIGRIFMGAVAIRLVFRMAAHAVPFRASGFFNNNWGFGVFHLGSFLSAQLNLPITTHPWEEESYFHLFQMQRTFYLVKLLNINRETDNFLAADRSRDRASRQA